MFLGNETVGQQSNTSETTTKAGRLLEELMRGTKTVEDVRTSDALTTIRNCVQSKRSIVQASSRTAALWLQYMDMIDILREFIKAERTANWHMHLEAASHMLPYFAASGHNLYTKSCHLYLQSMEKLKEDCPAVYEQLASGYHVVRRSDRQWAGLSTDLVIEQCLMRSLKSTGGLTRGSGMTERQRLTWLLSMPACAETNLAMQELTGIKYNSSEQNKDMTKSRQTRDMSDTVKVLNALMDGKNPFAQEPGLRNIINGVNAEDKVDVDKAREKGEKILSSMLGKSVVEYSFKRKEQSVTLAAKSSIKIDGERIQVDPQLLFQRLVIACMTMEDLESVFQYELCSFPAALFENQVTLRKPQKALLADYLWTKLSPKAKTGPDNEVQYVLDGGALLHRITWPRKCTYKELCRIYCQYVKRKYGDQVKVVFDGYNNEPSTKNMTQLMRSTGKTSVTVTFTDDMTITMKKDSFLSNAENKRRFIAMLRQYLADDGCDTLQAVGDADVLIAKTAVASAATHPTALVGDDTDLLVLLCYYVKAGDHDVFFRPEPKLNAKERRVWNIKVMKEELGKEICQHILFLHAVTGSDTTSRPFGIGKAASLKKFESTYFQNQAKFFDSEMVAIDDLTRAGENALVELYGGKRGEELDSLRYRRFYEKVTTRGHQIRPHDLPPTSAAAKYHSLRVFLQVGVHIP